MTNGFFTPVRIIPADQFKGQAFPTSSPVHRAAEHLASLSSSLYLLVLLRLPRFFTFVSTNASPWPPADIEYTFLVMTFYVCSNDETRSLFHHFVQTASTARLSGLLHARRNLYQGCCTVTSANSSYDCYCDITRV